MTHGYHKVEPTTLIKLINLISTLVLYIIYSSFEVYHSNHNVVHCYFLLKKYLI